MRNILKIKIFKALHSIVIMLCVVMCISHSLRAQSNDDLYLKAKAEIQYLNYQQAIELFTKAIIDGNGSKDLYFQRGKCYFQLKKYSEAKADFLSADNMEPNLASYQIAQCEVLLGNNVEAVNYIKRNLQSKFKVSQRIYKLDKFFEPLQKTKEWKDVWKEEWYTPLENSISEIHYFYETGKLEKALELADVLSLKHKNNSVLIQLRGRILCALNDFDASVKEYDILIQQKPYLSEAYTERADVLVRQKKYNKALDDYNKALELDPSNIVLFKKQAESEWRLQQYDPALNDLKKYLAYYNQDQDALFMCGMINFDKMDYYTALSFFNELLEKNKKEVKYFIARGNTYLMCKSYKYAEQDYAQALDINPKIAVAYMNRGIVRFEQGDLKSACRDWQKAFDLKESDSLEYLEKRCKQQQ